MIIPDFSIEKSASSDSERPQGQTRREFVLLCGVSQILCGEKSGITLQTDKILVGFCRATPSGQILLSQNLGLLLWQ